MISSKDILDQLNKDFYPHVFELDNTGGRNELVETSGCLFMDKEKIDIRWANILDFEGLAELTDVAPECFQDSEKYLYSAVKESVKRHLEHEKNLGVETSSV